MSSFLRALLYIAIPLALCVVMLGAYTRLTEAGLGCPDWPGCYGHIIPLVKGAPIDMVASKAWTEMIHRYIAGLLGLFIISICILGILRKESLRINVLLLTLLGLQAALGMWTVTLKLLPVVVMGHLIGGMLIFALLCTLQIRLSAPSTPHPVLHRWLLLGVFILIGQILLGGLVSSNYAGLACIGFPSCNGQWIPSLYLRKAFDLFSPIGLNYQGGLLESPVRITIQFLHRIGAFITTVFITGLALFIWFKTTFKPLRVLALIAFLLVSTQFMLGVINVLYLLPLMVAVLHNGVAAMLLATLFMMTNLTKGAPLHVA